MNGVCGHLAPQQGPKDPPLGIGIDPQSLGFRRGAAGVVGNRGHRAVGDNGFLLFSIEVTSLLENRVVSLCMYRLNTGMETGV